MVKGGKLALTAGIGEVLVKHLPAGTKKCRLTWTTKNCLVGAHQVDLLGLKNEQSALSFALEHEGSSPPGRSPFLGLAR